MFYPMYYRGLACYLVMAVPVVAQTVSTQPPFALEEVIVTAQKKEQSVQDVAASVNVLSADALADFSLRDFKDIEQLTAGLTLDSERRNKSVSLRGVSFDPDSGARPVVDLYWNEINVRPDVLFQQMYDIERIEVLRGAQGVLQGRTSPSGAIAVVTKRPSLEVLEAELRTSLSDNNGFNSQVAMGLPIIEDHLAIRVAGVYDENDGSAIHNLTTGKSQSALSKGGRFSVLWQPLESLRVSWVADYQAKDVDLFQAAEGFDESGERPTLGTYDRLQIVEGDGLQQNRNYTHAFSLQWQLERFSLDYIYGYQDKEQYAQEDLDVANERMGFASYSIAKTDTEADSHELRLSSLAADDIDFMVGAYYSENDTNTLSHRHNSPTQILSTTLPIVSQELAVFAHASVYLTEQLTLQMGGRWQQVEQDAKATLVFITPQSSSDPLDLISSDNEVSNDEAVTGSIKLKYDLSDDHMVYASYDKGYRPGGLSISAIQLQDEGLLFYDEETSDAIELGIKSTFLAGLAQLNAALFYQQFEDYISRKTKLYFDGNNDGNVDPNLANGLNFNGDATVQGIELEGMLVISRHWLLGGNLSYVDAKFDEGINAPCNQFDNNGSPTIPSGETIAYCDFSNKHVGEEPNWSLGFNSEYSITMENIDWFVRGLYKYSGRRVNEDLGQTGGYSVVNVYTGLRAHSGAWDIALWAKNVFAKKARLGFFPQENTDPQYHYRTVKIIPEREVGVDISVKF